MPNRIIKESIRESYSVDKLSFGAECTFYRLMTYADDFGIFKADARLINKALFPLKKLKDSDVAGYMNEISQSGMVLYYLGSDGKPYGIFRSWQDHNTPRNTKSKFPQPIEGNTQYFNDINTLLQAFENNCKQLQADAPLIQSNPIQYNPNPNPNPIHPQADDSQKCPVLKIINLYHGILPELPQVKDVSQIKLKISARWKDDKNRQSIEWWTSFFTEEVKKSDFLMGKVKDFQANLDWITGPQNFSKILNGAYRNKIQEQRQASSTKYANIPKRVVNING